MVLDTRPARVADPIHEPDWATVSAGERGALALVPPARVLDVRVGPPAAVRGPGACRLLDVRLGRRGRPSTSSSTTFPTSSSTALVSSPSPAPGD
jgi:hypothetical protein